MGSSMSCLVVVPPYCSELGLKKSNRQVMVMKDDGVIHCFKEGSHVKDVLVAHPAYQIIKCNSDRTLLSESFQLSANQLYFLLSKGSALNDKSINLLLRIAASRNPTLFVFSSKGDDQNGLGNHVVGCGSDGVESGYDQDYATSCKRQIRSQWKPSLQTIPEVSLSTILQSDAGGQ